MIYTIKGQKAVFNGGFLFARTIPSVWYWEDKIVYSMQTQSKDCELFFCFQITQRVQDLMRFIAGGILKEKVSSCSSGKEEILFPLIRNKDVSILVDHQKKMPQVSDVPRIFTEDFFFFVVERGEVKGCWMASEKDWHRLEKLMCAKGAG